MLVELADKDAADSAASMLREMIAAEMTRNSRDMA